MTRRSLAWVGLAVGFLALVALRIDSDTPVREPGSETLSEPEPSGQKPEAPPTAQRAFVMPPHDAPLAASVPDLEVRANAGDPRAACRLGMELIRCAQLEQWRRVPQAGGSELEFRLEAKGNLGAANLQAEQKLWEIQQSAHCAALPNALRDQGAKYLRQAARAGDPYAMLAYAEGAHFPLDGRGIFVDPGFDAWRRDSVGMAHAALRSGNPAAAFSLQLAYQDDHGIFGGLVPDDPYLAYVHHLLVIRLFGHREQRAPSSLDPAAQARARQEADDLHRRLFEGRRFPGSRALTSVHLFFRAGNADVQPFCADPG